MTPGATPQAIIAHRAASKLRPPENCETCGVLDTWLQRHHDDYSKPLEVRWLCRSCHQKHHVALAKAAGTYKPARRRPADERARGAA